MSKSDALIKRFRASCLRLPETSEVASWGHPNFRAGKKTFATIEWIKGRPSFAFRLGSTAAQVHWTLLNALLDRSYRLVALKRMIFALDGTRQSAR